MADWKGLDPGGTEQLWDPNLLVAVLEILKENEPFSRGDREASLYLDLEEAFPETTWRADDADGTFRPVFRKTNPWVKLGLIGPETNNAFVTPIGDELLAGEIDISEVFISALKGYQEADGTRSFALMSTAALELPNEVFTLQDVEFGISRSYADGTQSLSQALTYVRANQLSFPAASRRTRTLRSFMNALVSAGALSNVVGGWKLRREEIATEISSGTYGLQYTTDIVPPREVRDNQSRTYLFSEITPGRRLVPTFDATNAPRLDPIRRALLLERATSIHENLVEQSANVVRSLGFRPIEDVTSFDLAIIEAQLLVEIKSINFTNAVSQLRKALVQLPEYRWKHRAIFNEHSHMAIIVSENPLNFIGNDYHQFIEEDRGIKLFWRDGFDLVDSAGLIFSEYILSLHNLRQSI